MAIDTDGIESEVDDILAMKIGVGKEIFELSEKMQDHFDDMLEAWVERVKSGEGMRRALIEIAGIWVRSILDTSNIDTYRDVMMQLLPLLQLGERVGALQAESERFRHGNDDE